MNRFRSYFHFSSTESKGITVLLSLVVLALSVSALTMQYWVRPPQSLKTDATLLAAWRNFKERNEHNSDYADKAVSSERVLFPFDPNTLDSLGFLKLGLRPVTTKMLLNWRRKGKVFYKKEEFRKLYTLTEEEYNILAPYIIISVAAKGLPDYHNTYPKNAYTPPPDHVDINTTDSATLVRLRGIGPFFAHKILERRNALGGYLKHEQLMEAYKFKDSVYTMLKEKLIINPQAIRKIKINTASEEQFKVHPYIGEKIAKNILIYRDAIKRFEKIEQLRQVPLMNEDIYRKITPYISLE